VSSRSAAVLVNDMLDGLLYGDPERKLQAGLQTSPDTFQLMQRDGCSDAPVPVVTGLQPYWYALDECRVDFMSGLLANGLASSIKVVRADERASSRHSSRRIVPPPPRLDQ